MKYKREVTLLLLKAMELNSITTPTGHSNDFKVGFEKAMACAIDHLLSDALNFIQLDDELKKAGASGAYKTSGASTEHTDDFKGNPKTII